MVLRQEGWHYEIEKPDEPLTFKGVVYNEMKVCALFICVCIAFLHSPFCIFFVP